jgi:hypothetical protein
MLIQDQIGIVVSAIMIVSQLSLIVGDNFFFRWSTRVVIGFSVMHALIWGIYWSNRYAVQPIMKGELVWIIPFVLGLMMYTRLTKKWAWVSKYPMGLQLGVGFGVVVVSMIRSQILDQIKMTIVDLLGASSPYALLNAVLVFIGSITVTTFFFFTKEHTGLLGKSAYLGRAFIMCSIAVIWAGDYIWAMSMLAGQLQFLIRDFLFGLVLGGA